MGLLSWLLPDPPKQPGITVDLEGTEGRLPVIYGYARVKPASTVFKMITGRDNRYLVVVDAYCEGPVAAIETVFLDGKDASDQGIFYGSGHGRPYIEHDVRLAGFANQTASDSLVNFTGVPSMDSTPKPNWRTTDRLRGVVYNHLTLRNHKDAPYSGEPSREALIKGKLVWDPRDSTQDQDDETSWTWRDNPALCLLDYLRNPVYGKGLALARINLASFIDAANFCDQHVTGADGQLRPLMTCNVALDTDNSIMDNVQTLLSGMRGSLPQVDGELVLVIERDTAAVMELTEDDLAGKISIEGERKDDCYNRVIVKFSNPAADYQEDEVFWPPAGELYDQWLAEDFGVELETTITLDTCADREEALQMAEVICRRSRVNMTVSVSSQPRALALVQEDVIELTSSVRQWVQKPFRVEKLSIDDELNIKLDLREHQNSIYPWTPKDAITYPPSTGYNGNTVPAPEDLAFTPIEGNANYQGKLTWSIDNAEWVIQYRVEIYRNGTLVLSAAPMVPELYLSTLDTGNYGVSIVSVTNLGKESDASTFAFTIAAPPAPNGCDVVADNFTITLKPTLAYAPPVGTEFEFYTSGTDEDGAQVFLSRGRTLQHGGLLPEETYWYFIRTVNAWGASGYLKVSGTTTNDPSSYLDLLDGSITEAQLAQSLLEPIQLIPQLQSQVELIPLLQSQIDDLAGAPNWDSGTAYAAGEYVKNDGTLYRAKQDVPAGTSLTDTAYWENLGAYESINDQLVALAAQISDVSSSVDTIDGKLTATASRTDTMIAAYRDDDGSGRLADVLAGWKSKGALRTERTIRATENTAFAQRIDTAEAAVAANAAAVQQESTARADADSALGQRIDTVQAAAADNAAAVQQESTARADADSALGQRIDTVQAAAGDNTAAVQQLSQAQADLENGLSAMWKVSLGVTADGKYYAAGFGTSIENTNQGLQSNFYVLADRFAVLNQVSGTSTLTTPFVVQNGQTLIANAVIGTLQNKTIIQKVGGSMQVFGIGFGSSSQFIEWFGPDVGDPSNCTEANGSVWKKVDGSAYFGGAITTGDYKNSVTSSLISSTASVDATFGSLGGLIQIAVSLQCYGSFSSAGSGSSSGTTSGTVVLERSTDGGNSWSTVMTIPCSGEWSIEAEGGIRTGSSNLSGSGTFTDSQQTTATRYYRARVVTYTSGSVPFTSQRLSFIATEE